MTHRRLIGQVLALAALACLADPVCADAGLPRPQLDLTFVFKNLDEYPKYDFYLKHERGFGAKRGQLQKVEPGTPIHLGGRRQGLGSVFLIAVPRGQEIVAPERADADWLRNAPPNGLQSEALRGDAAGASLESYSGYDITYRVRLEEGRLEVTWAESNLNSWWSNFRLIAILIGAACVLIPVTIVTVVVIVLVRWLRKPAVNDKLADAPP